MKKSAGILLYRLEKTIPQFFLVHPGGPFFAMKNEGWWTIPKGEIMENEDPLTAAIREFKEETGYKISGDFIALHQIKQKGGKIVLCWLVEGNIDEAKIKSNNFELEWPPKSGKIKSFAEIDRGGWFCYDEAMLLINEMQCSFLTETMKLIV